MITRTPRFVSLGITLGLAFTLLFSTLIWPHASARARAVPSPVPAPALTPLQIQMLKNDLRTLEYDISTAFMAVMENFPSPFSENPYASEINVEDLTSRLADLKAKIEASMMPLSVDYAQALEDMESKLAIIALRLGGSEEGPPQETRNFRVHGKAVTAAHVVKGARAHAQNGRSANANPATMMLMPAPGQITGTVKNAVTLAPLQSIAVLLHDQSGIPFNIAGTNASGIYNFPNVDPGTYYMSAYTFSQGFLNQVYGGGDIIIPNSTNVTVGAPVVVNDGATTSGVNFFLNPGGKISGKVTDSVTNLPPASPVLVTAVSFGGLGQVVKQVVTDAATGMYELPALPAGLYFVYTINVTGHINEIYNGTQCNGYYGCRERATTGTPIVVNNGATTSGIDFQLDKGGSIKGNVKDAGTALNLPGIVVYIYDTLGQFIGAGVTNGSGDYDAASIYGGLAPGTYFARTANVSNYVNGLYNGGTCAGCDPTTGTPINLPLAGVTGINFQLNKGGSIRGSVKDYATGNPIVLETVRIYNSSGVEVFYTFSLNDGIYDTSIFPREGLPTGTYFARTDTMRGYIDVRFNGGVCDPPTCVATTGTPINVTAPNQTAGVNFLLQKSDIRGSVTDYNTGLRLPAVEVRFFNSSGQFITSGETIPFGSLKGVYFTEKGFLSGSYYAITKNASGYIDALYNGALCVGGFCNPLVGTPINMTNGVPIAGVNFLLQKGARIRGKVTDSVTGLPVTNVTVLVFDANTGQQVGTGTTDALGVYNTESGLPAGQYRVRAVGPAGFGSQAYFGFTCPCGPGTGTIVNVPAGTVVAGINMLIPRI